MISFNKSYNLDKMFVLYYQLGYEARIYHLEHLFSLVLCQVNNIAKSKLG